MCIRDRLHDKISDMNSSYYDLRGKIVKAERRIATLTERGEMWAQYSKYKPCLLYTSGPPMLSGLER